jgi:hypothetical protein
VRPSKRLSPIRDTVSLNSLSRRNSLSLEDVREPSVAVTRPCWFVLRLRDTYWKICEIVSLSSKKSACV